MIFVRFTGLAIGMMVLMSVSIAYSSEGGKVLRKGLQPLIPTVSKLDIGKVAFFLRTKPEFHERLHARALDKLTKSGLYPIGSRKSAPGPPREPIATLTLTLKPEPLDEICPGKVLYETKLVLEEHVVIERNPEIRLLSITWSYAASRPAIRGPVTIEELETDLHQFLQEFIIAYKMGNPA